ncbi:single-strand selective monofunctional uracil DNA glycosylase isoform X2 [Cuculus canorus]|uniref:single-strand selective monofunctional uracil DNA glycosylase isoform X2 n=1 Tax=Cuculus canorus TaxID=55661 RepID=UPI0023AB04FA|nr:single-strand selective monofunctional uracil DNA glycosylase isoform X2 [Cuculus canorus]
MEETTAVPVMEPVQLVSVKQEDENEDDDDEEEAGGLAGRFLQLEWEQNTLLRALPPFGDPVSHVYRPLDYAWELHRDFVRRYCRTPKRVLFLGMNPGPFGMAQTGVPFGEAWHVREWLRVAGTVQKPPDEHPKRPVLGLSCHRAERSQSDPQRIASRPTRSINGTLRPSIGASCGAAGCGLGGRCGALRRAACAPCPGVCQPLCTHRGVTPSLTPKPPRQPGLGGTGQGATGRTGNTGVVGGKDRGLGGGEDGAMPQFTHSGPSPGSCFEGEDGAVPQFPLLRARLGFWGEH